VTRIEPTESSRSPRAIALAATVLGLLLAVSSTSAYAQVRVEGTIAAMRVDASRTSLVDVLSAVGTALNIHYRSFIPLHAEINGTYAGPFREVIARLLVGYDYVLKSDREAIEVLVTGRSGERAVVATPPAPARPQAAGLAANPATPWREQPRPPAR